MVQINLISKKKKAGLAKNWILISTVALFVSFVVYFVGATLFVIVRLSAINSEIKKVDEEAVQVSAQISANKDSLSKYVLSKYILDRLEALKKDRFRYKDYLDQVAGFMPANAVLTNVDFATKGWMVVSVSLSGISSLKALEDNLTNVNMLSRSEFSSVFSESVSLDRTGLYNAKLHFQIKTNGGK